MKQSLSIVIPSFNGRALLEQHLPSVIKHSKGAEIVVVDDASDDDTIDWLKKTHPKIKAIKNEKNLGFARSVNLGFQQATGQLVFLLNNDVSLHQDTISKLTPHFNDKQLFGVGCLEQLPDGSQRGKSSLSFKRGLFVHSPADIKPGPTAWVFGASGMFDKSHWQQLQGFDLLFHPAYYEDIDISYRAWKTGLRCHFEPKAVVDHAPESTMNKALGPNKQALVFKNQILFLWKNNSTHEQLLSHFLWLPYHLIFTAIKTKGAFIKGFFMALGSLTSIKRPTNFTISDTRALQLINQ